MSEAILNIRVRADGVDEANSKLDSLDSSAAKAERSVKSLSTAATMLKGALGGVLAAFSVGALGNLADEWSDLNSRVALATGSMEKGTAVMSRLHQMANATYSSLRTTTEAFIANSATFKALGKSTQQQIDYTEALNNALVVSGAKGQVAASVQDALAKAMALGALKGDQLNSVIANGGRVVELLAEKLGVSTLEVRKLGAEGKITGDVIYSALVENMQKLREEADSMDATIGDAWQRMSNNALAFIGTLDQVSGSSGALSQVLLYLADNVDRLIIYAGTAAFAFGTVYVGAMAVAAVATGGLTGALAALRVALLSTGIGALIVILGEVVYQLLEARKATGSWGEAFSALAKRLSILWQGIKYAWFGMIDYMRSAWYGFLSSAVSGAQKAVNAITSIFGKTFNGFDESVENFKAREGDLRESAATMANGAVEEFRKAFASFSIDDSVSLAGDGGGGFGGALGEAGKGKGAGKKGGGGDSEKSRAAERIAREMEHRLEALKQGLMTEEETVLAQYQKDLETLDWHLANKKISEQEYLEWKARVTREHEQEMQQIRAAGFVDSLNATGEFFGALAGVMGSGNEKMLRVQKTFAAAGALVNAYLAASQVLADPKLGFFSKFAAVAAVLAKGMALVSAIKSGGSAAGGGGGSAGNTQAAAPPEKAPLRQMAEINVHGEVFGREQVIGLIEKINDVQKDGHVISWKGI